MKRTAAYVAIWSLAWLAIAGTADAQSYSERMAEAGKLRLTGYQEKAETIYDEILAKNGNDTDALVGRGFCRLVNPKSYDAARADFEKAVELAPSYVDAYIGLAILFRRQGQRGAAREILARAYVESEGDPERMRYLAETAWREAQFPLARDIDREYPPAPDRKLIPEPTTVHLVFSYDWVDDRGDWDSEGVVVGRRERQDFAWWLSEIRYSRDGEDDYETGLGVAYRHTAALVFEYDGYVSDGSGFLADQKHRPRASIEVLPGTALVLGADMSAYGSDWARVARIEARHAIGELSGKYSVLWGRDNFDKSVTTHILEIEYLRELRFALGLGLANGNETVDLGTGTMYSDSVIDTVYGSLRFYFTESCGLNIGVSREWRSKKPFRTTGFISGFRSF